MPFTSKISPDIFALAVRRLGLPPDQCLVVEDAVSGVAAAKAAGCRCLGIISTFTPHQLFAAGAHWTAPDLEQAPDMVLDG
jgi:beta-phosphoglucomutase-like phosphatase (HAD superfamily)